MSLQKLLSPIKAVDERILRGYTEISQGIPDDKLYKITTGLTALSIPLQGFFFGGLFPNNPIAKISSIMGQAFCVNGEDIVLNIQGLRGELEKDTNSGEIVSENPATDFLYEVTKFFRLPVFTAGVALLGKSIYDVGNYIFNNEPLTNETLTSAVGGLSYLSLASSMYLKDRNPKLLQKKPLLKSAFEYLGEKTKIKIPVLERAR